ncbi:hypothetical protein WMF38_56895 [Sorangium sp. So ce118]
MKVSVKIGDVERASSLPGSERWIDVDGQCPSCKADEFRVIGDIARQKIGHDTVTAPALALCCGSEVGAVHVELNTIFGLEEDRAVLNGRPRVY